MAVGFEIDSTEIEGFARALLLVPERLKQEMIPAATRIGIAGEAKAKAIVAVDTGYLRRSITHLEGRWVGDGVEAVFGTATHYARYVEYGTRYMDEKPYMTPAAEAIAADANTEFGNAVERALGSI